METDRNELLKLWGRKARCTCGKIVPSTTDLGYFEFRGEGSRAADLCTCGCTKAAHDHSIPVMASCGDGGFTPRGGMEFDSYFCGHLSGQ